MKKNNSFILLSISTALIILGLFFFLMSCSMISYKCYSEVKFYKLLNITEIECSNVKYHVLYFDKCIYDPNKFYSTNEKNCSLTNFKYINIHQSFYELNNFYFVIQNDDLYCSSYDGLYYNSSLWITSIILILFGIICLFAFMIIKLKFKL